MNKLLTNFMVSQFKLYLQLGSANSMSAGSSHISLLIFTFNLGLFEFAICLPQSMAPRLWTLPFHYFCGSCEWPKPKTQKRKPLPICMFLGLFSYFISYVISFPIRWLTSSTKHSGSQYNLADTFGANSAVARLTFRP